MADKLAVCSWSGGKDSCFAFYTALAQGIKVSHLVNTVSKQFRRVRFHGVKAEIIQAQADAIGINLIQKKTSGDGYEKEFREAVGALAKDGIAWIVTGDIHLEDSRRWIEKVSADLGLGVLTPLWGRKSEDILKEFIESGFEAMVVSAQADIFDKSWVGRKIDQEFLRDIRAIDGIDACGENGEYHTLVTNGPIFKKRVEIGKTRTVHKESQWGSLRTAHWFLDILHFNLPEEAD